MFIYTHILIYIYMSKASGLHLSPLTLHHGDVEAYLDCLASAQQVSDIENLIRGPVIVISFWSVCVNQTKVAMGRTPSS